jgi:6-phosphogluconate dehydrogenase
MLVEGCMQIGMIGLGKMGLNLMMNLRDHGVDVMGYDVNPVMRQSAIESGLTVYDDLNEFTQAFDDRKIIWVMVPAGKITDSVIRQVSHLCQAGDIIIDGGNSFYQDSQKNSQQLKEMGIHFLDCGTSGGTSGARNGACLMVGGEEEVFNVLKDVLQAISVENGCLYAGKAGSGHYLKMVHNGIEYGMMQAIGEGFEVLEASEFDFDFEKVARVWNNGSVIRSWLVELVQESFKNDPKLEMITGASDSSGEAQWTVEQALQLKVPTPVISLSLMMRYRSKQNDTFAGKVVSALRNAFGGHSVTKK